MSAYPALCPTNKGSNEAISTARRGGIGLPPDADGDFIKVPPSVRLSPPLTDRLPRLQETQILTRSTRFTLR